MRACNAEFIYWNIKFLALEVRTADSGHEIERFLSSLVPANPWLGTKEGNNGLNALLAQRRAIADLTTDTAAAIATFEARNQRLSLRRARWVKRTEALIRYESRFGKSRKPRDFTEFALLSVEATLGVQAAIENMVDSYRAVVSTLETGCTVNFVSFVQM